MHTARHNVDHAHHDDRQLIDAQRPIHGKITRCDPVHKRQDMRGRAQYNREKQFDRSRRRRDDARASDDLGESIPQFLSEQTRQ